ncbi:hypothetical protein [Neorhizobium sp. S3-V5DH]|uniref:plasmid mobilization protein n=1 Tax=Neorhizobium sp. S3-V5DH TaxID=2485166 RepID=UPI001A9F220A|nr:hypothetical protein [Neorhizobium sp. S3-V5DH]
MMGQRDKSTTVAVWIGRHELQMIKEAAAQAGMTVSNFCRTAALEFGGIQPFFSDEDRLLLLHLRDELRAEGFNLTGALIALNRAERISDLPLKKEILSMQRVIAALCIELSGCARKETRQRRTTSYVDQLTSLRGRVARSASESYSGTVDETTISR